MKRGSANGYDVDKRASRKFRHTKYLLTRIGEHTPSKVLHLFDACVNFLSAGHWLHSHGYCLPTRVEGSKQLFELLGQRLKDAQVLYLEFGVYKGASMRLWSQLLHHPKAMLHGFDSFEGLPESWRMVCARGDFDTSGQVPTIHDPRVSLFKGWFEDTLPRYTPPNNECLVINIDCDLYSSAKTVLKHLEPYIKVGTYIYFDEFNNREHELKAWDEFTSKPEMQFELIAADVTLTHVLFRRAA